MSNGDRRAVPMDRSEGHPTDSLDPTTKERPFTDSTSPKGLDKHGDQTIADVDKLMDLYGRDLPTEKARTDLRTLFGALVRKDFESIGKAFMPGSAEVDKAAIHAFEAGATDLGIDASITRAGSETEIVLSTAMHSEIAYPGHRALIIRSGEGGVSVVAADFNKGDPFGEAATNTYSFPTRVISKDSSDVAIYAETISERLQSALASKN